MGIVLNALGALAFGALGWFALEFIGRPVRAFFDLRRQVRTHMLHFQEAVGQVPLLIADDSIQRPHPDVRSALEARATLRDLSAELISFGQSEWLADYFVRRLGFEPVVAGESLAKFAHGYTVSVSKGQRTNYLVALKALKFPAR